MIYYNVIDIIIVGLVITLIINLITNFPRFVILFLLFGVPFIIAPFGITEFENPKVIIAEGVVLTLLIFFLFTIKATYFKHLYLKIY